MAAKPIIFKSDLLRPSWLTCNPHQTHPPPRRHAITWSERGARHGSRSSKCNERSLTHCQTKQNRATYFFPHNYQAWPHHPSTTEDATNAMNRVVHTLLHVAQSPSMHLNTVHTTAELRRFHPARWRRKGLTSSFTHNLHKSAQPNCVSKKKNISTPC